jgi:hypothetical protein
MQTETRLTSPTHVELFCDTVEPSIGGGWGANVGVVNQSPLDAEKLSV